ncbi:hypothetical protein KUL72_13045 [Bradyrhizobium arachidis]|uniref:hypothetical protein n=1 Tax=Bradyrhizobium arachidis TaxID=858423 RepID=UPI00216348A4|nr:hypothetical protein [Bradyrhizobium arachidis]UVO39201.1 hypothetical protein KUL72_13045 [Bradyrhizobium arachidis]
MLAVVPLLWNEIRIDEIRAEPDGIAYFASIDTGDDNQMWRSGYRLRENGALLKARTDIIDSVRAQGHGTWAYWRGGLWFSSSDNTDPRWNGRSYVLQRPTPIPVGMLIANSLATLVLLVLAVPGTGLLDRLRMLTGLRSFSMSIFACLIILILYLKPHYYLLHDGNEGPGWTRWGLLTVVAIGASHIKQGAPRRLGAAMSILSSMFALGFGMAASGVLSRAGVTQMGWSCLAWSLSVILAVIGGAFAFRWPGLAAVPTCAYVWVQHYVRRHSLIVPNVDVDWTPVAESTIFLMVGLAAGALVFRLLDWALRTALPKYGWPKSVRLTEADVDGSVHAACTTLLLLFIAVHMGNYFHSAMAKMLLDGGPFSWVIGNQTYFLSSNAAALGAAPLRLSPNELAVWRTLNIPVNALTLTTQLAALAAPLIPATIAPLTAIFDVWHIGVFIFSGIFFWKWMLLNGAIIVAWPGRAVCVDLRVRLLACVLTVLSPQFFGIIELGWYDTPALNRIQILAVDEDGAQFPVPAAFFRAYSFAFVSTLNWGAETQGGLYPTGTWGSTKEWDVMQAALNCKTQNTRRLELGRFVHPKLAEFVRATHAERRAEQVQGAADGIYFYPHHVFSNPFAYEQFSQLKLDRIRSYVILAEELCTDRQSLETTVVQSFKINKIDVH